MAPTQNAPAGDVDRERSAAAPRFDQATRVILGVIAVVAAFFALMVLAHAGPMLVGAGCRWSW